MCKDAAFCPAPSLDLGGKGGLSQQESPVVGRWPRPTWRQVLQVFQMNIKLTITMGVSVQIKLGKNAKLMYFLPSRTKGMITLESSYTLSPPRELIHVKRLQIGMLLQSQYQANPPGLANSLITLLQFYSLLWCIQGLRCSSKEWHWIKCVFTNQSNNMHSRCPCKLPGEHSGGYT